MKSTKPKLNVRLLRRIKRHILEEPRRFFMEGIIATGPPGGRFKEQNWYSDLALRVPECGTAGCIHGWTAMLSGKSPRQAVLLKFRWSAQKLGLPRGTANNLFLDSFWPEPFSSRYLNAKTPASRAKIAADRIEHFIATRE